MMDRMFAWIMVLGTILLTSYGQLVLKWQTMVQARPPFAFMDSWPPLLLLLLRPWVISALVAAFGASLCWMLALSRIELSRVYPFMALNFVLVCGLAIPLFGEALTTQKVAGIALIILGTLVLSR